MFIFGVMVVSLPNLLCSVTPVSYLSYACIFALSSAWVVTGFGGSRGVGHVLYLCLNALLVKWYPLTFEMFLLGVASNMEIQDG